MKCHHLIAVAFLLSSSHSFATEWSGTMSCGASQTAGNPKSAEPFTAKIALRAQGDTAVMERVWSTGKERLEGSFSSGGGSVRLEGLGWFFNNEPGAWKTRALLVRTQVGYQGRATIESRDGRTRFRDCDVSLSVVETSASSSVTSASNNQHRIDSLLAPAPIQRPVSRTRDAFFAELHRVLLGTSDGADQNLSSTISDGRGFLRKQPDQWWPALEDAYRMDCKSGSDVFGLAEHTLDLTFGAFEASRGATRNLFQRDFKSLTNDRQCRNLDGVKKFLDDVLLLTEEVKKERVAQIQDYLERQRADSTKRHQTRSEHAQRLKSGAAQVSSIDDAALLLDAPAGMMVVISPGQRPDRRAYKVNGVLARWERGVLTGRVGDSVFAVLIGIDTKYLNGAQERLRLDMPFTVVGRFVDTAPTTIGKMGAVFEATHISVP